MNCKINQATLLCIPAAGFVLLTAGCASKGYVQSQVDELRQQNQREHQTMQSQLASLQNSTDDALARAETAFNSSQEARDLALGKAGFEELNRYTVFFAFDSDRIDTEESPTVNTAAEEIGRHPEALVDVYGFADPTGPESYNLELGRRRAMQVLRQLVSRNPGELSRFAAVSFGEESLTDLPPDSKENAGSRRVVISLVRRIPYGESGSPAAEMVPGQ